MLHGVISQNVQKYQSDLVYMSDFMPSHKFPINSIHPVITPRCLLSIIITIDYCKQ